MKSDWTPLCSLQVLKQRAFLMSKIREYFSQQNVLEVETPILSSAGNTDVNINSFTAEKIHTDRNVSYLRTSPEFPLKRLLCSGVGDVFEIGKVFRRGEFSKTHNVEFSMLEWYRIDYDYNQLIQDVVSLFGSIFSAFELPVPDTNISTYKEAFLMYLNINIDKVTDKKLNAICNTHGYSGSQLTKDEGLDFLFATQIQKKFENKALTFLTLYPASQAALAQINPDDRTTSLRFEVFFQGHELGNGYQELTNGNELLERFKQDNCQRVKKELPQIDIDKHLIDALTHGMPYCSGIAVGIDRLLMIMLGCEDITELLTFNAENS